MSAAVFQLAALAFMSQSFKALLAPSFLLMKRLILSVPITFILIVWQTVAYLSTIKEEDLQKNGLLLPPSSIPKLQVGLLTVQAAKQFLNRVTEIEERSPLVVFKLTLSSRASLGKLVAILT